MINLTEGEKRTVMVIFHELARIPFDELNKMYGVHDIIKMHNLLNKLKYEKYCEVNKIAFEDMLEEDYIDAERWIVEHELFFESDK